MAKRREIERRIRELEGLLEEDTSAKKNRISSKRGTRLGNLMKKVADYEFGEDDDDDELLPETEKPIDEDLLEENEDAAEQVQEVQEEELETKRTQPIKDSGVRKKTRLKKSDKSRSKQIQSEVDEKDVQETVQEDPADNRKESEQISQDDQEVREAESNRVALVKPLAQDGYRSNGPGKAYKYWDFEKRLWLLTADFWAARQAGGDLWDPIWVWYENGVIHHVMDKREIQRYLP